MKVSLGMAGKLRHAEAHGANEDQINHMLNEYLAKRSPRTPLDNYERIVADARNLQEALQEATEQEKSMKKQKYYLVLAEANTPPLAMFAIREWAEAWKSTHCATAVIEDFDMVIRLNPATTHSASGAGEKGE